MMKHLTNKVLAFNLILIILLSILYFYWMKTGADEIDQFYYVLTIVITYSLSVGGLFAGIVEYKNNRGKAIIGIIGNTLLMIIFLSIFIIAINS